MQRSVYEPWASSYIDYSKLKKLLREDEPEDISKSWTENDEAKFVEELLNSQLEKVNSFQDETYKSLRERTTQCEARLQKLAGTGDGSDGRRLDEKRPTKTLDTVLELDKITKEINELEKYSRVNFTGFLKAAKKHDRRRGSMYKVRPLLQVRLAALPFNSEDYSPLLYEISAMYSFARQLTEGESERSKSMSESISASEKYTSRKFWVHPENLLEVKTYVLRRLPILVYNPQSSKVVESGGSDPTLTSLYFDNAQFALYNEKVGKPTNASSLKLKWFGQLANKPELFLEKKTVDENGGGEEIRVPIKEKNLTSFIAGANKMEKIIEKLRGREGIDEAHVVRLRRAIDDVQSFIQENELRPILRVSHIRTAFQIPGNDKVRISIDTDVAFVREVYLGEDGLYRSPTEWHRGDIDRLGLEYPFSEIGQDQVSRFPYALLEIKISSEASKKTIEWIDELTSSHLVKEAPRFSKFVHGVASLFEDQVNSFPFWLSILETDIRRDPQEAFREEQEKKAQQAANEQVIGSFIGSRSVHSFKAAVGSPVGQMARDFRERSISDAKPIFEEIALQSQGHERSGTESKNISGLLSFSPFSNSKYGQAHRKSAVSLPPGVEEPVRWIKDINPVHVEPKVWLANQRTFVKWQHISVLLASLSLGLYNAAGETNDVARGLAVIYTIIAVFTGGWGWWMYIVRSRMIRDRSGKNFDNIVGPILVCIGLTTALCLNFTLRVRHSSKNGLQAY